MEPPPLRRAGVGVAWAVAGPGMAGLGAPPPGSKLPSSVESGRVLREPPGTRGRPSSLRSRGDQCWGGDPLRGGLVARIPACRRPTWGWEQGPGGWGRGLRSWGWAVMGPL